MNDSDFYAQSNYKTIIRHCVKQVRTGYTLRRLAEKIPIQYTYLSKVLNDDATHLNEDHLFRVGELLELTAGQLEYLGLLRAREVSANAQRREHLQKKIESIQRKQAISRAEVKEGDPDSASLKEAEFLFDPFCFVVNQALDIRSVRENPRLLCPLLGLSAERLREILVKIEAAGLIEWNPQSMEVTAVRQRRLHFNANHPFMRANQKTMKPLCEAQLSKLSEKDKQSFMATFSADDHTLLKIKEEFQTFLKKVESLATNAKSKRVYQLNFDLFHWI